MNNNIKIDFTKLTDLEIDGVDMRDYPDFCDAFLSSGLVQITKEEFDVCPRETRHEDGEKYFRDLTEAEIDFINEEASDFVHQKVHDKIF